MCNVCIKSCLDFHLNLCAETELQLGASKRQLGHRLRTVCHSSPQGRTPGQHVLCGALSIKPALPLHAPSAGETSLSRISAPIPVFSSPLHWSKSAAVANKPVSKCCVLPSQKCAQQPRSTMSLKIKKPPHSLLLSCHALLCYMWSFCASILYTVCFPCV